MYETVYRDLYHYALCLMKNPQEAEDAVSEAVVAAYENIHKLKKEEAFRSWIFTILTNKCKKRLKKALKEEPGREEELPEQPVVPDYDLAMDVRKAFFVLSEEEQILVGLSVFGGYCSQEIGEMMRLNPNTVRSKRSRALKKDGMCAGQLWRNRAWKKGVRSVCGVRMNMKKKQNGYYEQDMWIRLHDCQKTQRYRTV